MRLSEKQVKTIRSALVDFEQSSGTPNADRSAIKLAAVVETVLELAEEDDVEIEEPEEPTAPMGDITTDPDQVEVAESEQKPKRTKVDHAEIIELRKHGLTPKEISKQLGVGCSTVFKHLQFERDMGAK